MRIVGLVVSLTFIVMGMLSGGTLFQFIDIPSLLIIVVIPLGCTLFAGLSPWRILRTSLSGSPLPENADYAARALMQVRSYVMASGWIGFLVGGLIMSANLDELKYLGPGLALSLLTVLYGVIGSYIVLKPLQHRLEELA